MNDAGTAEQDAATQPSDESIKSHIHQFFNVNPAVDGNEVQVSVKDAVVTLEGGVEAVPEKRMAREIAETTPGVKGVIDNLTVKNFVERTDEELHAEVKNALIRDI